MKKILFALIVLAFASCTKEPICTECTVYLINPNIYPYQMTMTGKAPFMLRSNETIPVQITAGKSYKIEGEAITDFAHNDFSKSVKCEGGCGDMVIEVK